MYPIAYNICTVPQKLWTEIVVCDAVTLKLTKRLPPGRWRGWVWKMFDETKIKLKGPCFEHCPYMPGFVKKI